MENCIRRIDVHDHSLEPVSAEVWISVLSEHHTTTTEVRGRLMGPSCLYASTVEVAYPLRPLPPALGALTRPRSPAPSRLTVRAIIPEASLWEPQCPFLYHGSIELWQDGRCCDRRLVGHGVRSVQLRDRHLYVNGRPLQLQGLRLESCSDKEATQWHRLGYNLLIAPVAAHSLALWDQADRCGFLVLGQLGIDPDEARLVEELRPHASCLGWLSAECQELNADEVIHCYLAHGKSGAM